MLLLVLILLLYY